jgi:predicted PurR-regulated permease PerM
MPVALWVSYLLAASAVPMVLCYHLLPAVFAGLAVHVLTERLARLLPARWGHVSRGIALGCIFLMVMAAVLGLCLGLWSLLQGEHGTADLLATAAQRLDDLKQSLPPSLAAYLPDTVEELRAQLAGMLRTHRHNISQLGISGVRTFAQLLFGMVIGGISVFQRVQRDQQLPPLAAGLHARVIALAESFRKVVFAQVKISTLNTVLTALYLLAILPLCGVHLPMAYLLVLLTFVAGMLPVIGNLISNGIIVLISSVAAGSLLFLALVHKLEYFTNAKIVGGEVKAGAWELLSAMLLMEAVFGFTGLVAAPVVYAWLKAELKAVHQV